MGTWNTGYKGFVSNLMASESLRRKAIFCRECSLPDKVVQILKAKAHNQKSKSVLFFNGSVPFHVTGQTIWHLIEKTREYDLFREHQQNWKVREKLCFIIGEMKKPHL